MHGGLGLHVQVLSQPISPAQISPFAQSALEVQVFPPAPPSVAAPVAVSGFAGSVGAGSAVAAGAVGAGSAVVTGVVAAPDGSDVGGTGAGFDPHAIASALSATNEKTVAATSLGVRVMRAGKREPGRTSIVLVAGLDAIRSAAEGRASSRDDRHGRNRCDSRSS